MLKKIWPLITVLILTLIIIFLHTWNIFKTMPGLITAIDTLVVVIITNLIFKMILEAKFEKKIEDEFQKGFKSSIKSDWFKERIKSDISNAFDHKNIKEDIHEAFSEAKAKLYKELKEEQNKRHAKLKALSDCGIAKVYLNREEAISDIKNDLQIATNFAWFSGVAFSETLNLKTLMDNIPQNRRSSPEIKIMLMDVLRSPAIYRSFLESKEPRVRKMIFKKTKKDKDNEHSYFYTQNYTAFKNSIGFFHGKPSLKNKVKFYGHNPNCWMIRIDDTIYFQPYALGSNTESKAESVIGSLLPIFKFEKKLQGSVFLLLVDHFDKLWSTSNTSLEHMEYRLKAKKRILQDVFSARGDWLRHVYGALYGPKLRLESSRSCLGNGTLVEVSKNNIKYKGKVKDSSQKGICLSFDKDNYFEIQSGDIIKLKVIDRRVNSNIISDLLTNSKGGRFEVVHPQKVFYNDEGKAVIKWEKPPIVTEYFSTDTITDPGEIQIGMKIAS